eukprot:3816888-Prorocentrum_lima.AAC.1
MCQDRWQKQLHAFAILSILGSNVAWQDKGRTMIGLIQLPQGIRHLLRLSVVVMQMRAIYAM